MWFLSFKRLEYFGDVSDFSYVPPQILLASPHSRIFGYILCSSFCWWDVSCLSWGQPFLSALTGHRKRLSPVCPRVSLLLLRCEKPQDLLQAYLFIIWNVRWWVRSSYVVGQIFVQWGKGACGVDFQSCPWQFHKSELSVVDTQWRRAQYASSCACSLPFPVLFPFLTLLCSQVPGHTPCKLSP